MKSLILLFLSFGSLCAYSQFHDETATSAFKYKEVGDTIFVNNKYFVPGDTLFLNQGSSPDKSFIGVYQQMKGMSLKMKYLPAEYSNLYLIFEGRKQIKNASFKLYEPIFYDPKDKKKKRYVVSFYHAVMTNELKGF